MFLLPQNSPKNPQNQKQNKTHIPPPCTYKKPPKNPKPQKPKPINYTEIHLAKTFNLNKSY